MVKKPGEGQGEADMGEEEHRVSVVFWVYNNFRGVLAMYFCARNSGLAEFYCYVLLHLT